MALYLPPAGIDDFSHSADPQRLSQRWHERVTSFISNARSRSNNPLASPLFYDQLADTSGVPDSQPEGITWNGFPLRLRNWFAVHGQQEGDRFAVRAAEVILRLAAFGLFRKNAAGNLEPLELPFRVQDEYCEWHVEREAETIRSISFTCEPPEYWEFLAGEDFDLVHRLYKKLLHRTDIPPDDLKWAHDVFDRQGRRVFRAGDYNRWNVWNTERGAIHLTHPANSLMAEVFLASDGTIGWPIEPDPQGRVDEIKLMCCAGRGGINRSSDPLILSGVFNFARRGLSVALANPIGLYMKPFTLGGLLDRDENPVGPACLKFPRASEDGSRILRAEIAPPDGANFTLDQCTLDGQDLRFGGQIAQAITMVLFGVAKAIPGTRIRRVRQCPQFCCQHPVRKQFKGTFSFREFSGCDRVEDQNWADESFDVPKIDEGSPLEEVGIAKAMAAPGVLKPIGRKVVSIDAETAIDIEEY